MTSTRTDIHRPSAAEFDPEAYQSFGYFDLREEQDHVIVTLRRMKASGYTMGSHGNGQCGHCGTNLRYAALLARADNHEMIWVGEKCLDGTFSLAAGEFQRLRKAAHDNRDRRGTAGRIAELVDDFPLLADLTYPEITEGGLDILADIGARFRQTGRLSERQIEVVGRLLLKGIEFRDAQAARDAERDAQLAASTSTHQGAIKQRLRNLAVTLVKEPRQFFGDYGCSTLLTFVDTDGNEYVTFASGYADDLAEKWGVQLAEGAALTLTGTVKEHTEFAGIPQTKLARVTAKAA